MTAAQEGTLYRHVAIIEGSAHLLLRGMRWPQGRGRQCCGFFIRGALRSVHAQNADVTHG